MRSKEIFILTFLLFSCGRLTESPFFDTPQPKQEEDELNEIPKKLIGIYESLVDSSFLIITNEGVIIKNILNVNWSITEVDSNRRSSLRDTIYRDAKSSMKVKITSDSVFQRSVGLDTLLL